MELLEKPVESFLAYRNYLDTEASQYRSEVHYRMGRLFEQKEDHAKAVQFFLKYRESGEEVYASEVELRLGRLYEKQDNFPAAVASLLHI